MSTNAVGAFALSQDDINSFLSAVPQAAEDINSMHIGESGIPSADWDTGTDQAIPPNGRAYQWGARWILVSIDANYTWHFIDITSVSAVKTLVTNANNPTYFSPPGNVYADIWNSISDGVTSPLQNISQVPQNMLQTISSAISGLFSGVQDDINNGLNTAGNVLMLTLVVIAVIVVIALWRTKEIQLPGFTAKGGA